MKTKFYLRKTIGILVMVTWALLFGTYCEEPTRNSGIVTTIFPVTGTALWARTASAGTAGSGFFAVAVDVSGNVYAAGNQDGHGSNSYGPGVSVQGSYGVDNVVLVKYDSNGIAQWAQTVGAGTEGSLFFAVAVDASGNVYAAGNQSGTGSYTYGPGISAQGSSTYNNIVLVKYDSDGTAQWAQTVSAGTAGSSFNAVAVDISGNVYAAGFQSTGSLTYGLGVSTQETTGGATLVKYDSNGTAQWAQTVSAETAGSSFFSVAVDALGNVYAAGRITGTGIYTYGPGVNVQGTAEFENVVLVKYDSNGTAQWAKTVSAGTEYSLFNAITVDAYGNVYAAGEQRGVSSYTYGPGVSTHGSATRNVVLVKYNSNGTALWVQTVSTGTDSSTFYAVALDATGNVYAAGYQTGDGSYTYGPGVTAQVNASGFPAIGTVLVKYDSSGIALWAQPVSSGTFDSRLNAVAVNTSGDVYATGYQTGTGIYTYGPGVTLQGINSGFNAILVKYAE